MTRGRASISSLTATFPRLILAWVSTEAVRTQKPRAGSRPVALRVHAKTRYLLVPRGATRGANPAPQPDEAAVQRCSVSMIYEDRNGASHRKRAARRSRRVLVESEAARSSGMLWESKIELSESFLQRDHQPPGATRHEHPHGPQALLRWASTSTCGWCTAPSRSVLRYVSPGGRCTGSSACTRTKPSDKRTVLDFRRNVLRELKKIKLAWPELNYSTVPGVLILLPSVPAITPSSDPPRLVG